MIYNRDYLILLKDKKGTFFINNLFIKIVICIVIIIILLSFKKNVFGLINNEYFINIKKNYNPIKWTQVNCNNSMGEVFKKVLKDNNLVATSDEKWNLFIPCSYNRINYEINTITDHKNSNQRYIYIIDNADQLAGKDNFWSNMVELYGVEMSSKYIPMTYILYDDRDMERFKKEYNKNNLYILKKNIQRQLGLKITNNYDEIINASNDNFVVVQYLLQDPYIIYGRKTNMRFYLLIICNKGEIACYVFDNGFMYYTAELFVKDSLDPVHHITTGYIDRKVYEYSPLTHYDLKEYLDNYTNRELLESEKKVIDLGKKLSEYVFNNIYKTLTIVSIAQFNKICNNKSIDDDITFQLFGCDIAIDNKLDVKVIEINKGPDIGQKDAKDGLIKYNMMNDMLAVLKIIDKPSHNYIKLCETSKSRNMTDVPHVIDIISDFL